MSQNPAFDSSIPVLTEVVLEPAPLAPAGQAEAEAAITVASELAETEAVIATSAGVPGPDLAQVAVLRRAIRELEDDVRTTGTDDDAEILADGVLAPVAREVDTARRLVRATAPGRRGRR